MSVEMLSSTAGNLVIDCCDVPANAVWTVADPIAEMTPTELCHHLRDLIAKHQGGIGRECVSASLVLACLLRAQGFDARVSTGVYHRSPDPTYGPIEPEEHAYVRCEGSIYDATREQFDNLPLVSREDDPRYEDLCWFSYTPPECPTPKFLAATYGSPHHSWGGRNGWFAICSELISGDPWDARHT